jgi:phage N-6-adenine-methyltransferase
VPPPQKPGKSKQDYSTPYEFIEAVYGLLNITEFAVDLAADASNAKAPVFYGVEEDSLAQDWARFPGWHWLNPPFGKITPWVERANIFGWQGVKVAMLLPAAVGSNWYREHVEGEAYVFFLNPRLSFDGVAPYPKDCMLALYGTPFRGASTWRWK